MLKVKEPTVEQIELWKNRKPARRMAEVPREILQALNSGWIESKNLVEWLSIDQKHLACQIIRQLGLDKSVERSIDRLPKASALKQAFAIGTVLGNTVTIGDDAFRKLSTHPSDIARQWVAALVGLQPTATFKRKLAWMKPLADDANPGVREIAWIALRDPLIRELDTAIDALIPWTGSRRDNLRRFASEITRPRGVWAAHVPVLKEKPEMGLPILEPLRADGAKYVRDSVANWLNDASKSRKDWVVAIAKRWTKESPMQETELILTRAMRTLRKGV